MKSSSAIHCKTAEETMDFVRPTVTRKTALLRPLSVCLLPQAATGQLPAPEQDRRMPGRSWLCWLNDSQVWPQVRIIFRGDSGFSLADVVVMRAQQRGLHCRHRQEQAPERPCTRLLCRIGCPKSQAAGHRQDRTHGYTNLKGAGKTLYDKEMENRIKEQQYLFCHRWWPNHCYRLWPTCCWKPSGLGTELY